MMCYHDLAIEGATGEALVAQLELKLNRSLIDILETDGSLADEVILTRMIIIRMGKEVDGETWRYEAASRSQTMTSMNCESK